MAGRSHSGVPRDGDELRKAIEDAGGTLTVPDPPLQVRAAYRRAMHDLMNGNLLLSDRRLRYRGRDRGDLVMSIVAVDELPAQKPPTEPIAVPETLRGCHPIIRTTQNGAKSSRGWIDTYRVEGVAHLRIHRASLRRCLLVLQALISEGERRRLSRCASGAGLSGPGPRGAWLHLRAGGQGGIQSATPCAHGERAEGPRSGPRLGHPHARTICRRGGWSS